MTSKQIDFHKQFIFLKYITVSLFLFRDIIRHIVIIKPKINTVKKQF